MEALKPPLSSPMATLPSDIIKAILCRLRVKDLLRCRPVCQRWCSLIDGPDFIKMHLLHHSAPENNGFVVLTGNCNIVQSPGDCHLFWLDDLRSPTLAVGLTNPLGPLPKIEGGAMVLGSCNGLLALRTRHALAIWNPSTRRFRKLPDIPGDNFIRGSYSFVLEFQHDPETDDGKFVMVPQPELPGEYSDLGFGFGHDPVHDDYKLVRLAQSQERVHSEIHVYSAKSDTWKRINHDINNYYLCAHRGGVLLGNTLHWLVSQKHSKDIESPDPPLITIISFDLVTEEVRVVPLPDYEEEDLDLDLGVIGGSLCAVFNNLQADNLVVSVWVMREYGVKESWTRQFSVVPWKGNRASGIPLVSFVASSKKNDRDGVILKSWPQLTWYDLESKRAEENLVVCHKCAPFSIHVCAGSLVRLDNTEKMSWKPSELKSEEDHAMHEGVGLCFRKASKPGCSFGEGSENHD